MAKKQVIVQVRPGKRKSKMAKQQKKMNSEVSALGKMLRAVGGIGGTALGGYVGQPGAGAAIGTNLGAALSRWLGSGDYTVTSNSIVSRSLKGSASIPVMHTDGQTVRIVHKEFLTEIKGANAFTVTDAFELNPGNNKTFPWLSRIANQFAEYSFKGVVFHYVPTSGTFSGGSNSALGSVMMQTSYRATDTSPSSKLEMLNEYWSCESVPSETMAHPIECNPKENPFNVQYVRTGSVPVGDSKLLYDLGITTVAVSGQATGGTVLGDLWVTYDVELKKPLLKSNVTTDTLVSIVNGQTSISPTNYWGTAPEYNYANNIPITVSGRQITFGRKTQPYVYRINVLITASTVFSACDLGTGPTITNGEIVAVNGDQFNRTFASNCNTGFITMDVVINNNSEESVLTLPSPTITGTIDSSYLSITSMGYY